MGLIRDLNKLSPACKDAAEKAIAILNAQGVKYWVNETLRTKAVQNAYFAQGRQPLAQVNALREDAGLWPLTPDENKKIVTKTTTSIHFTGNAIDICPADKHGNPRWNAPRYEYEKIAIIMKSCGFEWGGDWKDSWDQPHYQLKGV